jgi:hypothetical protein
VPRLSNTPIVKAFKGHLPEGCKGIEFKTDVPPDEKNPPGLASWSGDRPGVRNEDGFAKINVQIIKTTQFD